MANENPGLDQLLAVVKAGPQGLAPPSTANMPQPIGGYVAPATGQPPTQLAPGQELYMTPLGGGPEPAPIYFEGDEVALFAGASYEEKFRVQRALVEAGLLVDAFRAGVWDVASQQAMNSALSYANQMGKSWEQAVATLATSTQVQPTPKALIPNTRELSEIVEATFESYLKRKPSKAEIAELAGDLREAYEAGIGTEDFTPEELAGADMPDYETEIHPVDEMDEEFDPADINAVFEQRFKGQYADEIGAVERAEDVQSQDVAPVFDGVSNAMAQTPSGPAFIPTPGA